MNKKLAIIGLLFFVVFGLKAQFSFGLRGGYGSHGIYLLPEGLEKYQVPLYNSNFGAQIIYNNQNNAGLVLEVNYAPKGWSEEDTSMVDSYFSRTLNYLEIPVYSRWEIGHGKVRPLFFIGPYVAWLLGESSKSNNFEHIMDDLSEYNHYELPVQDFHYGIKVGLGLKYDFIKNMGLFFDVRYDLQIAGSRDIFIDRPNGIEASRLTELSASIGILWHIIPQKLKAEEKGYTPKKGIIEDY